MVNGAGLAMATMDITSSTAWRRELPRCRRLSDHRESHRAFKISPRTPREGILVNISAAS